MMKYHFDPARPSAAGYAEYRPVASNATAEGARNRRVDIVILNSTGPELSTAVPAPPASSVPLAKQGNSPPLR